MVDTDAMRASDRDRQDVVDRLRTAVGDGRLRMDEYMERMETAYQAVTLGDLAPLCADLPGSGSVVEGSVVERKPDAFRAAAPSAIFGRRYRVAHVTASFARLPRILQVLWAIWLTEMLVNTVVWVLVAVTTGHLIYPSPLSVAGPPGAVLLGISSAVLLGRRVRS